MQANRRRDTLPEIKVRQLLHAWGLRFRVDFLIKLKEVKARPDIVFTRARLAVFIDGCFWHGCPEHKGVPKTNTDYWLPKIKKNRERDERQTAALEKAGWIVLRFWEHDDPERAVMRIQREYERLL